jgi:poly(hydroxyalkanoate) granule-associated protein
MATKKKNNPPSGIKESATEIWLAGLGAFNIMGEEGSRLFQELVEKGRDFQEEHEGGTLSKLTERAMGLKEDAKSVLSKVTTPLEDGLSATMQRLGMPTRTEIIKLTHRVEELTRIVQQAKTARAESAARARTAPKPKAVAARPKAKTKVATRAKATAGTPA